MIEDIGNRHSHGYAYDDDDSLHPAPDAVQQGRRGDGGDIYFLPPYFPSYSLSIYAVYYTLVYS